MGMFDDLIPPQIGATLANTPGPWNAYGNLPQANKPVTFDDLVPHKGMTPVTDPALLAQLNGPQPVTDPAILAQLNGNPAASMSDDELKAAYAKAKGKSAGVDVAKSLGAGAARGILANAGLSGDIGSLISAAASKAGNLVGLDPATVATLKQAAGRGLASNMFTAPFALGPTTGDLTKAVENFTGPIYQPQTGAGRYAETIGEFAPNAMLGPGSLTRRIATQAIFPAVASEAAGQATEGTGAEPYARVAAALVAPASAEKLASRLSQEALPTAADLRAAGSAAYRSPEVTGVQLDPNSVSTLSGKLTSSLGPADAINAPRTAALTAKLNDISNSATAPLTIEDIKQFRTGFNSAARDARNPLTGTMTTEGQKAGQAAHEITDYFRGLQPSDVVAGDANAAANTLREGDANYAAGMRAQAVDRLMRNAELQAGATYSGGNTNNAIRQKLKSLLANESATAGYSPEELAQLKRAVLGTKVGNAARYVGKLLGGGGGMAQMILGGAGIGASYATGNPEYMALPLLGIGARKIGDISAARQAGKFSEMVRSRSPLGQAVAARNSAAMSQSTRDAIVRALLSANPATIPARLN